VSKLSTREGVSTVLEEALETLYKPTPIERRGKSIFWTKTLENPLLDTRTLSGAKLVQITGISALQNSWSKPGFREWFVNQGEYRERLHYLFDLALDAAESVLLNEDPKAQSARVNMIRVISELANKFPNKYEKETVETRAIAKLSKGELELYLERQGIKLTMDATAVDVTAAKHVPKSEETE
jgi:hypothetical protein